MELLRRRINCRIFQNKKVEDRYSNGLVIVHLVLFLAMVVVLNAAIRSLYLNGNLKETWRLIAG